MLCCVYSDGGLNSQEVTSRGVVEKESEGKLISRVHKLEHENSTLKSQVKTLVNRIAELEKLLQQQAPGKGIYECSDFIYHLFCLVLCRVTRSRTLQKREKTRVCTNLQGIRLSPTFCSKIGISLLDTDLCEFVE